jgi:hypothetical protein
MSAERATGLDQPGRARVRQQGLRIALAASAGIALAVAAGSPVPFLAPLFAVQFLVAHRRPLGPVQGLGMFVLIVVTGQAMAALASLLGDRPLVFLPVLWLVYLACFWLLAVRKGGPAPALVQVIAIIVPILEIRRTDLGEPILLILAYAAAGGVLLSWAMHALLPDPATGRPPLPGAPAARQAPTRQVVASSFILTAIVGWCLADDRLDTAIVIPITVASLLGQLDPADSLRAALGLMVVNLLGGVVASVAFALLEVQPTLWLLFLTVLLVGILFGGRAATDPRSGKIFGGALTIFLILFGLGVSPLPSTTPESFATRIGYLLFAILYTIATTATLWPWQTNTTSPAHAPPRPTRPVDG